MKMVVPGTDVSSSQKAVELAHKYEDVYAAVGIHPHHVFEMLGDREWHEKNDLEQIDSLMLDKKVVAVGEVGMDRHVYEKTKYAQYQISPEFIELQKDLLSRQIEFAIRYGKSLILHNREAKKEVLTILKNVWDKKLETKTVFHCCEADSELLEFAKKHKIFIGVDGDLTYGQEKQEFIKEVPLSMLVLETDAPFLLPEPLRSQKKYPNEPANLNFIAMEVARVKGEKLEEVQKITFNNSCLLFSL